MLVDNNKELPFSYDNGFSATTNNDSFIFRLWLTL